MIKILISLLLITPVYAAKIDCGNDRLLIDLKDPVTGKRSLYCAVKKANGSYSKDGPEVVYDVLGKVEARNYYVDGVIGEPPTLDKGQFSLNVIEEIGPQDHIYAIAFSNDHTKIATSSTDLVIRIFDLQKRKRIAKIKVPHIKNEQGNAVAPTQLAWSKDGNLLAASFSKEQMIVFDTLKGIPHATFDLNENKNWGVNFIEFTDKGLLINQSGLIHFYDTSNWQKVWKTTASHIEVHIHESEKIFYVMDKKQKKVLKKSLKNGKTLESFHITSTNRPFTSKVISQNGKLVATVERDVKTKRKDLKTIKFAVLKEVLTNKGLIADRFISSGSVRNFFSPDGKQYVVLSTPMDTQYDSELKVYNTRTKKVILEKLIPFDWAGRIVFSKNGKFLAYSSKSKDINILELRNQ